MVVEKCYYYSAPAEALLLCRLSNIKCGNLSKTQGSTKLPVGEAFHRLDIEGIKDSN